MTKRDPNPNTDATTGQSRATDPHNTHSELLREAAEDVSDGRIVDESRRASDPNYSRDIAAGTLSERETQAAYPPSAHEADGWFSAPAHTTAAGGRGLGVDNDPSDGDVSMDSELGEDLLGGELASTEHVQVVRGDRLAGADVVAPRPKERFVIVAGENKKTSVLDTLRERVQEGVGELQERGEQLAFAAKLKLEMRQLESDRSALFTRLGRAYHRRAEPEVLAVIETELRRIERDIRICEGQMEAHQQHIERAKARREHEQLKANYPQPDVNAATAFEMRAQTPRVQHEIGTDKRDTFFGLDKGGVDEQATVLGGNAAFDTQRSDTDKPLTIANLPEDER